MLQSVNSTRPYRILIADDHAIVRGGIRALLPTEPGIEICGEAGNGREVLASLGTDRPDMIVMDLNMPQMHGLQATRLIRQAHPEIAVLVLSMHSSDDFVRESMRLGVRGYILKADADVELRAAVARIRQGGTVFSSQIAEAIAKSFVARRQPTERGTPVRPRLTEREIAIVRLLAEGKTSQEVAAILSLSKRTADTHRYHVMRKLGFSTFSDLIRFAVRSNLIEL